MNSNNFEIKKKLNFRSMHETLLDPKITNNIVINYKETSNKLNPTRNNDKPKGYKNYIELYRKHLIPDPQEKKPPTGSTNHSIVPTGPGNKTTFYKKHTISSMNDTIRHLFSKRNTTEHSLNNRSRGVGSRNSNKSSLSIKDTSSRIISSRQFSSKNNLLNFKKTKKLIDSKDKIKVDILKNLKAVEKPIGHKSFDKQGLDNKLTRDNYKMLLKNKSISSSLMMKGIFILKIGGSLKVNESQHENLLSEPNVPTTTTNSFINKNLSNFNFKSLLSTENSRPEKKFIAKPELKELDVEDLSTIIKHMEFKDFDKDEQDIFKSNNRDYVKFIDKFNNELDNMLFGEV
jgi:hypothetical protein